MSKKLQPGSLGTEKETLHPADLSVSANSLAAFGSALESYGGNKSRWPNDKRAAMENLLAQEPRAASQLAQMQALEQVLATAAVFTPPNAAAGMPGAASDKAAATKAQSALVDQIVRAAIGSNAAAPPPLNSKTGVAQTGIPISSSYLPPPALAANNNSWRSATLLAASLVIGIFIGASTSSALPDQVLSELAALAKGEQLSAVWQDAADLAEAEFNEFDEEVL